MHRILHRGQDAEIDNSRSAALDEHERSEITVASHEDSPLVTGNTKQLGVFRLRQPELSGGNNVMPQAA